jgi:hypothetical protein
MSWFGFWIAAAVVLLALAHPDGSNHQSLLSTTINSMQCPPHKDG